MGTTLLELKDLVIIQDGILSCTIQYFLVKNEIGNLAVEVAEKILRKQLSSADAQNSYASLLAEEIKLN